jgi:hypothetical protein
MASKSSELQLAGPGGGVHLPIGFTQPLLLLSIVTCLVLERRAVVVLRLIHTSSSTPRRAQPTHSRICILPGRTKHGKLGLVDEDSVGKFIRPASIILFGKRRSHVHIEDHGSISL